MINDHNFHDVNVNVMIVIFWCEYHRVKSNQKYKSCRLKSAESESANLLDENLGGEGGEDASHHGADGAVGDGVPVHRHLDLHHHCHHYYH